MGSFGPCMRIRCSANTETHDAPCKEKPAEPAAAAATATARHYYYYFYYYYDYYY